MNNIASNVAFFYGGVGGGILLLFLQHREGSLVRCGLLESRMFEKDNTMSFVIEGCLIRVKERGRSEETTSVFTQNNQHQHCKQLSKACRGMAQTSKFRHSLLEFQHRSNVTQTDVESQSVKMPKPKEAVK